MKTLNVEGNVVAGQTVHGIENTLRTYANETGTLRVSTNRFNGSRRIITKTVDGEVLLTKNGLNAGSLEAIQSVLPTFKAGTRSLYISFKRA